MTTELPALPGPIQTTTSTAPSHPVYGGTLPETGFGVGLLLALAVVAAIAGYIARHHLRP